MKDELNCSYDGGGGAYLLKVLLSISTIQYQNFQTSSTSLTGTLSNRIQTGYESIYVTFQNKIRVFFIGTDRRKW